MIPSLSILATTALAVTGLAATNKAITFGVPLSVQPLVPLESTITLSGAHNGTFEEVRVHSEHPILGFENGNEHQLDPDPKSMNHTTPDRYFNYIYRPRKITGPEPEGQYERETPDKPGADDGENEAHEENTEDTSPNHLSPSTILRRAPRDCGTMVMDCSRALGACNNGCYYQNCVKKGQTVTYVDNGKANADINRSNAGTRLTTGTPCTNMPLSQRMYDVWPNWRNDDPDLETDEWPMAQMRQAPFVDGGGVQNTLRCIPARENGAGGNQLKIFRNGHGDYSPGKPKAIERNGCVGVFSGGETFKVKFDISMFKTPAELQIVDSRLPYCKPNPDCTNDGQQFYMTKLVKGTKPTAGGIMGIPYDLDTMNNYQLIGETDPVEAFFVSLKITGDNSEKFDATVSKYRSGSVQKFGTANNDNLAVGSSFIVNGLPRTLKISRTGPATCDPVQFQYGDLNNPSDHLAFFAFTSTDAGVESYSGEKYCYAFELEDDDGDYIGVELECWFAGW